MEWHAAAPLVAVLALAAGARCFEILGDATLKAAGRGGVVLRLSALRLVVVLAALLVALATGELATLAAGVLVARVAGALLSLAAAARELRVENGPSPEVA